VPHISEGATGVRGRVYDLFWNTMRESLYVQPLDTLKFAIALPYTFHPLEMCGTGARTDCPRKTELCSRLLNFHRCTFLITFLYSVRTFGR
jgi:hypothetical protein